MVRFEKYWLKECDRFMVSYQTLIAWMGKIVLIIALLMLLPSCNLQKSPQRLIINNSSLRGRIVLMVEKPLNIKNQNSEITQTIIEEIVDEFNQLNPKVTVFTKFLPTDQLVSQLDSKLAQGAGPDLVLAYHSPKILRLINTRAFRSIEESQLNPAQFRPEALNHVRYQGKYYGFPVYSMTQVLCYNKEKVQELPITLSDLIDQSRQGYSVGVHSGFVATFWGTGIFGGRAFDEEGRFDIFQDGGWIKWIKWLKQAKNEPNFILSSNEEALRQAFVQDELAYLTCSSNWMPYFYETMGKDKLGATLLPRAINQPATPVLRTGALLLSRASNPRQAEIALELAQYLTNLEQQNRIEVAIPFLPSHKNATVNRRLFPLQATLLDQAQTSLAIPLDDAKRAEIIAENGEIIYQKVLIGALTPQEGAQQLTQTVNRQL
ncbi:MAG: ABC transporter substrate-binding protein [Microcystaceae cyanobacterium]